MAPPEHFVVEYAINPWMSTAAPVDTELALKQWEGLREALTGLGHDVSLLAPEPGLPDLVYAANGAFTLDGTAWGARFRHPERVGEATVHERFYLDHGWHFVSPIATNEGEGDIVFMPGVAGGLLLAGYGFRTEPAAHAEAAEVFGRPVVSLRLVDPRFYHLDTALAALDDTTIAYYPAAFSASSQRVLRQLFPDAILADTADALAFGLNLVSDGRNVVLNMQACGFAGKLAAAGYSPVLVELSELKKGGGSVKCCVAELRSARCT